MIERGEAPLVHPEGEHSAFRRAVAAVCLVGIILVGGSAGARFGPHPLGAPNLAPPSAESLVLAGLFSPSGLAGMSTSQIEEAAANLARSARDSVEAREELAMAFPSPQAVLAFLALDRDVDDFVEASAYPGPAGAHYRRAVELANSYRPLRASYETLYAAAYDALVNPAGASPAVEVAFDGKGRSSSAFSGRLAARGELFMPDKSELPRSHPYALDVFFTDVAKRGEAELGPRIYSLSPGIVVASASDWKGGAGPANYKSGGLSPAAGNGVVVYDPASRRYYSYFHLYETSVLAGQIVEAGKPLGRGGNTGMNARKKGHGGHVHIEIYDAAAGRALDAYAILSLLNIY